MPKWPFVRVHLSLEDVLGRDYVDLVAEARAEVTGESAGLTASDIQNVFGDNAMRLLEAARGAIS